MFRGVLALRQMLHLVPSKRIVQRSRSTKISGKKRTLVGHLHHLLLLNAL